MIHTLTTNSQSGLGCSGQCQGCPGLEGCGYRDRTLGNLTLPIIGQVDWKWMLLAIVAGVLVLRMVNGRGGRVERMRQRKLARARAQYELASI